MKTLLSGVFLFLGLLLSGCGPEDSICPRKKAAPNLERLTGEVYEEDTYFLRMSREEPAHPNTYRTIERRVEVLSNSRISVTYEKEGKEIVEIYEVSGTVWRPEHHF